MTIVAPVQYREDLRTLGAIPGGPRGSAIGSGLKIAYRLFRRGSGRVGRRIFAPKRYTYPGAVGRGIGAGTIVTALLPSPDIDDVNGTIPGRPPKAPSSFQQRNRGQRRVHRRCRCDNRHRNC